MLALLVGLCHASAQEIRAPVRDDLHRIGKDVRSWKELRNQNIVMQQRDYSCGAAALATLLRFHWGDPVSEMTVFRELDALLDEEETRDRIKNGLTLTDLRRVSVRLGYLATIGQLKLPNLAEAKVPVVVGIRVNGYDHFAVVRAVAAGYVFLADPARGNVRTPVQQFERQWQKRMVLVVVKRGVQSPAGSALQLRSEELTVGQLNWHEVRRHAVKPPLLFPVSIRP